MLTRKYPKIAKREEEKLRQEIMTISKGSAHFIAHQSAALICSCLLTATDVTQHTSIYVASRPRLWPDNELMIIGDVHAVSFELLSLM